MYAVSVKSTSLSSQSFPFCLVVTAGQMQSIPLDMMVRGWLKSYVAMSTCHTPLLSPCMVVRSTGLTGGLTHYLKQTNGQDTMLLWSSAPTHSPLTCRFITHRDNPRVSHKTTNSCITCRQGPVSLMPKLVSAQFSVPGVKSTLNGEELTVHWTTILLKQ